MQIAIGLLATSFKDAQSYLTLFAFVPAVAGFVLSGERLAAASGWPLGFELNALAVPLLGSTASATPFGMVARGRDRGRRARALARRVRLCAVRESSRTRIGVGELRRGRSCSVVDEHGRLIRRIARSYETNARSRGARSGHLSRALGSVTAFSRRCELRTFVVRVAHNRAITHVAKEARRPRSSSSTRRCPIRRRRPSRPRSTSRARRLERAVAQLPLGQRLVVTLALEGFSPEEIANVLGIGVSAASVRLHRAKAALQDSSGGAL